MPETPPRGLPLKIPASRGRRAVRAKHGLTSWVNSKRLPQGKGFQAVRRELSRLREDLIRAHGGEKIGPDAAILVDSVVEALGVQKLLGLYVRKYGVVDAQSAKRGRLELSPVLGKNWISYQNSVRQGILALRELEKGRQAAPQADIEAILTSYSRPAPADDDTPTGGETTTQQGEDDD